MTAPNHRSEASDYLEAQMRVIDSKPRAILTERERATRAWRVAEAVDLVRIDAEARRQVAAACAMLDAEHGELPDVWASVTVIYDDEREQTSDPMR